MCMLFLIFLVQRLTGLLGFSQNTHTHTTRSHGQPKGFCNGYSFGPFAFPRTTPSKKFWPELLLNLYKLSSAGIDHGVVLP